MTPHKPKGRRIYRLKVPTRTGWVNRTTGTADRPTAKAMERMVDELGQVGKRRWDVLDPVAEGRLSLAEVWDAYQVGDLDGLVARMGDIDLRPHVDAWLRWLRDRVAPITRRGYRIALDSLMPASGPWWRSTFTTLAVVRWLDALDHGAGTKRKYGSAVASFAKYAKQRGLMTTNPTLEVELPPAPPARSDFYERDEVERLIEGSPRRWGDLFTLIYATGAEVSAALAVRRRYVDLEHALVRMPGTKTHTRDRVVIVAEWARPRLAEMCRGLLPDAPLFPGLDRHRATRWHARIAREQGLRHLKLHAARNHWAVRALRGGWSEELVANQLGHANAQMVHRVYGRFRAKPEDLARLERMAELEAQRREVAG